MTVYSPYPLKGTMMTRNPSNAQPIEGDALSEEPLYTDSSGRDSTAVNDPGADVRVQLQTAIFEVSKNSKGQSLEEILEKLRSAFAAHGVQEPPATWLEAVASSAFYGEPYIIDFPSAIAADDAVPAPKDDVRERIASRRELYSEELPGPAPVERGLTAGKTSGGSAPGGPATLLPHAVRSVVVLSAALGVAWALVVLWERMSSGRR